MITKRHLITAVLATFCLTTLVFMVVPTRSQTTPEYDPWADLNGDGKIDILDVVGTTGIYGASGNPTRPVVINHNWNQGNFTPFGLSPNSVSQNFTIQTAGFKSLTISVHTYSLIPYSFEILIAYLVQGYIVGQRTEVRRSIGPPSPPTFPWYKNFRVPSFNQTYQITSPEMLMCIYNNSTTSLLLVLSLRYYLSTS